MAFNIWIIKYWFKSCVKQNLNFYEKRKSYTTGKIIMNHDTWKDYAQPASFHSSSKMRRESVCPSMQCQMRVL